MNFLKNRNSVITYTVNKAMQSNMSIGVQEGEVVINAPWYVSNTQIQKIIEEKKNWIIQKMKEYEQKEKQIIKKEEVKLLGKKYALEVEYKSIKMPVLTIENREIQVTLPNAYKKIENKEILKILIDKMYSMVTKKEIEKIMEETRILVGFAPEDYEIRVMDKEIARCNHIEKKISIHPEIAKYSIETIRYIVLHEFCHLKYKNHTKSFYDMLETYMPNYEEYKASLSRLKY